MFWRSLFSRPILWIFTLLGFAFNVLLLNAISSTVAPSLLIDHESGPAVDHIAFWAAGWPIMGMWPPHAIRQRLPPCKVPGWDMTI